MPKPELHKFSEAIQRAKESARAKFAAPDDETLDDVLAAKEAFNLSLDPENGPAKVRELRVRVQGGDRPQAKLTPAVGKKMPNGKASEPSVKKRDSLAGFKLREFMIGPRAAQKLSVSLWSSDDSDPPAKVYSRAEIRAIDRRARAILKGEAFDPQELDGPTTVSVVNGLHEGENLPDGLETALQRIPKKAQTFVRQLRGWTVVGAPMRARLEAHWRAQSRQKSNESISLGYNAPVKTLGAVIAALEGLSDVPIVADFRDALNKAAAQANPDDALAPLVEQIRAFNPRPIPKHLRDGLPTTLPKAAPALYKGRSGIKASEFLVKHWQPYLDARLLHQHQLNRMDPKLKQALDNEFKGRRDELSALIPSKRDESEKLLRDASFDHLEGQARASMASALRQRARSPNP